MFRKNHKKKHIFQKKKLKKSERKRFRFQKIRKNIRKKDNTYKINKNLQNILKENRANRQTNQICQKIIQILKKCKTPLKIRDPQKSCIESLKHVVIFVHLFL